MQNVMSYFKIFPRRSPKWIILGGGLLLFYVIIPSPGQLLGSSALAAPMAIEAFAPQNSNLLLSQSFSQRKPMLPQAIADKVLQDLAQRTGQPTSDFKLEFSEATQWPNSCLGLAKPDEFCAQVITSGWRVVVTDGKKSWTYRTDQRGKVIRSES